MPCLELLRESIENVHELGQPLFACGSASLDRFGDTPFDVEFEDGEADPVESSLGGGELLEDFDAEARLLDHAADAAHLALDAIQTGNDRLLLTFVEHDGFSGSRVLRFSGSGVGFA